MRRSDFILAPTIAIIWFFIGLFLNSCLPILWVWHDQIIFAAAGQHISNPYSVPYFVNPPWTALIMAPFARLPLWFAVLSQMILMFVLLTAILRKFGGSTAQVILCLTSFFAFMQTFTINNDWLVYLGLLVPSGFSVVFLLIKPQIALGMMTAYTPRMLIWVLIGVIILLMASGIYWGSWIGKMLLAWQLYIQEGQDVEKINLAPMSHLPMLISLGIAVILMGRAAWKRDQPLAILGWLFAVPYLPLYSVPLYFAMLLLKWPLLAKIIFICTWIIYGGVILLWMI